MPRHATFAFLILALLICTTLKAGCTPAPKVWPDMPGKKRVLASFAPIYCFTQAVAGDDANVLCLLTTNRPHKTEMSHIDILKVRGADLILSNGLDLDDELIRKWVGSASKRVPVVKIGDEAVPDDKLHHMEEEEKHAPGEHQHKHGEHDPHVWLSPILAKLMVDKIAEELSKIEPGARERFRERANAYKAELDKLQQYGLAKLKVKKNRNIVAQHDSLHYFADAFHLKLVGHLRTQAGDEGSLAEGTDLLKNCKATPPAAITVEPQFPLKAPQMLQKTLEREGIAVQLVQLDPLETAPLAEGSQNPDPRYYLKRMYENIDNLDKGAAMKYLITIEDLRVALGDTNVLRGVNAKLERGKITALIGLNGSGKTTLLRALLNEVPYSGTIRFHCGHDHTHPLPEQVGYVPQKLRFDANMPLTVLDLLALARQKKPLFLGVSRKVKEHLAAMLARVGSPPELLDRPFEKISGGEQQRVLLALALEPCPELLLLDEPAAGVDFKDQESFYDLIARLNAEKNVTILLVSHEISMVSRHAHHVLCMLDGKIECEGRPEEIVNREALGKTFGHDMGIFHHHHS